MQQAGRWATCLLAGVLSLSPWAEAKEVGIALLRDAGADMPDSSIQALIRVELAELLGDEFAPVFYRFDGDWSVDGITKAYAAAYASSDVDVVVATGTAANQLGMLRDAYPKPTFLPLVIDVAVSGRTTNGLSSGTANLSYLADRVDFTSDIAAMRRVVSFERLFVVVPRLVLEAIPDIRNYGMERAGSVGLEVGFAPYDSAQFIPPADLDPTRDVAMIAGQGELSEAELRGVIGSFTRVGVATYSLQGTDLVRLGALAADAPATDWRRIARTNALNVQAVLLGTPADQLPTLYEGRRELTINMATARAIGLSPSYEVLGEAVLINEFGDADRTLSLAQTLRMAASRSLDVRAEAALVAAGTSRVQGARDRLGPQMQIGIDHDWRRVTRAVEQGQIPERGIDATFEVSQTLYADDARAAVAIERHLQAGREAGFTSVRLDTMLEAGAAYLNILRAGAQLRIQRDNLNLTRENLVLANGRIALGAASVADRYRWQSQLATARGAIRFARATREQTIEALNRILDLPITASTAVDDVDPASAFALSTSEFNTVVTNPRRFGYMVDYYLAQALERSPELASLDARKAAIERQLLNQRRDYWVPDIVLTGGASDPLGASGVGAAQADDSRSWQVNVAATLKLGRTGGRRAAIVETRHTLAEIETRARATRQRIEQRLRAASHAASAAFANIDFAAQAADAAERNLRIVIDAYSQGTVAVVELLDAQNASLQADERAANARYDFLVEALELQRSASEFEILMGPAARSERSRDVQSYVAGREQGNGQGRAR